jgi:hypothetical protein
MNISRNKSFLVAFSGSHPHWVLRLFLREMSASHITVDQLIMFWWHLQLHHNNSSGN